MLTKEEAENWVWDKIENGMSSVRKEYREKFGIGEIAEDMWDKNTTFQYGIEYGMLIAIAKIYGELIK